MGLELDYGDLFLMMLFGECTFMALSFSTELKLLETGLEVW